MSSAESESALEYQVLFDGTTTGEYSLEVTKERFAKLFKLDRRKVDTLFSGKEFVIKEKLTEEAAINFAIKVAEAGCECQIVSMAGTPANVPITGERRMGERRVRWRRGPRPGAIVSDRRVMIRRAADREFLEQLAERGGNIPPALLAYKDKG